MTKPLNPGAARAPRAPAEAGQPGGGELSRTTIVRERVLAALEAQLAQELHPSPSIAGEEGEDIPPRRDAVTGKSGAPRPLRRVARREAPAARRDRPHENPPKPAESIDGKRLENLLRELRRLSAAESAPADLDGRYEPEFFGRPAPLREPEMPRAVQLRQEPRDARAPLPAPPWANRPSPFANAMRVAAAIFSVVALVGASALVVMLAIGGEHSAKQASTDKARAGQSAVAASSTLGRDADRAQGNVPPVSEKRDEAPAITGAIGGKRDASRILSEAEAAAPVRGAGTVRPADTPMGGPFVAAQPAELSARPRESGDPEPQSDGQVALDSRLRGNERMGSTETASAPREPQPVRFGPAPSIPAQIRSAAAETGSSAVEPTRATRSAAVTMHVNMRAEPKNEAAVVMVVPEGRDVEIVDCGQWCEVVYDGRKGFIHKRFVAGQ